MRNGMTVKELISELLECEMDAQVDLKIRFNDTDLEYEDGEVGIELVRVGPGWGRNAPYITLNLTNQSIQEFIDEIK